MRAADAGTKVAEAQFEVSQTAILFSVAQAFYAAAIADEVAAARASNIEVARATVKNAEVRFQSGSVTRVDVDRAELALVRAEQAAREARFAQDQTYRALATLIQPSRGLKVRAVPSAAKQDEPTDLESALRLRPEFQALQQSVRTAAAQEKAYAWRWSPSLSAFGNLRAFNYDNFAREQHSWAVGAQLDWILYDAGVRDVQRRIARTQGEEAVAQSSVLRDTIADDLANSRDLLDTKRHAQKAAERSVDLAMETLRLVRTQYEAGKRLADRPAAGPGRLGGGQGVAGPGPLRSCRGRSDPAASGGDISGPVSGRRALSLQRGAVSHPARAVHTLGVFRAGVVGVAAFAGQTALGALALPAAQVGRAGGEHRRPLPRHRPRPVWPLVRNWSPGSTSRGHIDDFRNWGR